MKNIKTAQFPVNQGIKTNIDDLQISSSGLVELLNLRHEDLLAVESTPFFKKITDPPERILKLFRLNHELLAFSWNKLYKVDGQDFTKAGDYLNANTESFFVDQKTSDLFFPDIHIDKETGNFHVAYRSKDKLFYKKLSPKGNLLDQKEKNLISNYGKAGEKFLVSSVSDEPVIVRLDKAGLEFHFPTKNFAIEKVLYSSLLVGFSVENNVNSSDVEISVENEGLSNARNLVVLYIKNGSSWNAYTIKFRDLAEFLSVRFSAGDTDLSYKKGKQEPSFMPCLTRFSYWDSFEYENESYHLVWNKENGYYLLNNEQKILGKFSHDRTHTNPAGVDWGFAGTTKVIGDTIYFPLVLTSEEQIIEGDSSFNIQKPVGVYIIKLEIDKKKFVCDLEVINNNLILASPAIKIFDGNNLTEFGFCEKPEIEILSEGIAKQTNNFVYREIDSYLKAENISITELTENTSKVKSAKNPEAGVELIKESGDITSLMLGGIDFLVEHSSVDALTSSFPRISYNNQNQIIAAIENAVRQGPNGPFGGQNFSLLDSDSDYYEMEYSGYSDVRADDSLVINFNKVFVITETNTGKVIDVWVHLKTDWDDNRGDGDELNLDFVSLRNAKNDSRWDIPDINFGGNLLSLDVTIKAYSLSGNDSIIYNRTGSSLISQASLLNTEDLFALVPDPNVSNGDVTAVGGELNQNSPEVTHLYEKEENGNDFLYVGITFNPSDPSFIEDDAPDFLRRLKLVATSMDGGEVFEIQSYGPSPELVSSGDGERVSNTNTIIYKYSYTKPASGDIALNNLYNIEINRDVAEDKYVLEENQSLFSFTFDDVEYAVEDIEMVSEASGSYVEMTLDKEPEFDTTDIVLSLTIKNQKTDLNTVTFDGVKVKFSVDTAIKQISEDETNSVSMELKDSSVQTGNEQTFTNVYEYTACYRWRDSQGKSHFSASALRTKLSVKNYIGKNETQATLVVKNLNLSEKENIEIVLFRRLASQDPVDPDLTYTPGNMEEETSVINLKCTALGTPSENSFIVSHKEDGDLLPGSFADFMNFIFQPEGAEACKVQHGSLYLGGLNQLKNEVIQSQRADIDFRAFFAFSKGSTGLARWREGFNHRVLKLAKIDSSLIIFTERQIRDKVSFSSESRELAVGGNNHLKNNLAVAELVVGVVFQTDKGIHLLDRSKALRFWGWDINKRITDEPVVQVHSSSIFHEIFFIQDSGRVLSYNYIHEKWSSWQSARTITDFNGKLFLIDDLDSLLFSTLDNTQTKDHVLETGWFDFNKKHGAFYLKGINLLGDFVGFKRIQWDLFYNGESFSRETHNLERNDRIPEIYSGTLDPFGQDQPRVIQPKVFKSMKCIPKIQKIDRIKLRITINSAKIKISNIGFEVLPISGETKQKSQDQVF